jgi:GNAT superfamily N-acetyltransferase
MNADISIRPLVEADVPEADRVMRLAFGTFWNLADPTTFAGDAGQVHTRWRIAPSAAYAAELGGRVVGSNFVTRWGSVGFFGPLSVHPDLWNGGVGRRLVEPALELFASWQTRLAGLFTFAHSAKHIGLYQSFGFRPRFLTAMLVKPVTPIGRPPEVSLYSEAAPADREGCRTACRDLTDSLYEGLDVGLEVRAAQAHGLGETVLCWHGSRLEGVAVCHLGPGTEAGSATCYVKFGAVRPGRRAESAFATLMDACEALAAERGAERVALGVNTSRAEAYGCLLNRRFRIRQLGVAMHRPNEPGYSRPGVYCVDDWR